MDRSAEVVRQDHIQEAMRVKYHGHFLLVLSWLLQQGLISTVEGNGQTEGLIRTGSEFPAERRANKRKLSKPAADIDA